MAQIYMFVYVLIIFLSLFLVIINCRFELKTSSKEKKIEKSTKRQKKEITRLQLAMASSKGEQFQNATKITRHQLAMASRRRAYSPWRMEGLARRVRAV
ncbi:Nodule Cysteine-Rich (NCR) secreted peptide [Medicago truncatula]|uniref:Nodule Cysteine-Rich (NCR) secreted peptide n=1 Tax=Medicago truncatula TaxID=3880 RepID=G7L0W3_MEDTR|nr:Nodule Cysteine-Rich (NCR) secreted peptide [Medicago truncatula]